MPAFLPIYKRELKTYFQSPSTYVVLALFFLCFGLIFNEMMIGFSKMSQQAMTGGMFGQTGGAPNVTDAIIRPIFQLMISLVMFTIPILSMRLIAEEKSKGTFELLVSCPIGDWSILIGKYLALVTVGLAMLSLAAIYPLLTWWAGLSDHSAPEWPVVISCAFGMMLIFSAYSAFGLMASSFTDNQMTAAVITLIGLILWQIIGSFQLTSMPMLREIANEVCAFNHTDNFIEGLLTFKDVAYYLLVSFLFLFIAGKTLDARRWRI
jgi:ABC-2 type transport system permease protein